MIVLNHLTMQSHRDMLTSIQRWLMRYKQARHLHQMQLEEDFQNPNQLRLFQAEENESQVIYAWDAWPVWLSSSVNMALYLLWGHKEPEPVSCGPSSSWRCYQVLVDETKTCREGLLWSQHAVSTFTSSSLTVLVISFVEILRFITVCLWNLWALTSSMGYMIDHFTA